MDELPLIVTNHSVSVTTKISFLVDQWSVDKNCSKLWGNYEAKFIEINIELCQSCKSIKSTKVGI